MKLEDLRAQVDLCNRELIEVLARRFSYTRKIGKLKAAKHLSILDITRENEILDEMEILAKKHRLNPTLVRALFTHILEQVRQEHENSAHA